MVRDLNVIGTKARVYLNGHKLRIMTERHAIAPNASQVVPGGSVDAPGEILWKQGMMILVK